MLRGQTGVYAFNDPAHLVPSAAWWRRLNSPAILRFRSRHMTVETR